MIRTLISAAALAFGFLGPASAVTTVLVDDFSQEDQFAWNGGPLVDYPGAAPTVIGLKRTVTHAYSGSPSNLTDGWLTTGPTFDSGRLSIANDSLTSTGTVSWTLPAAFIPGTGSGMAVLKFDVLSSDLDVKATLKLGASTLGVQTYNGPGVVSFALGADQNAISASGGVMALVFTGPESYDMTIDNVRFEVSAVPETSTALMLLAGLLATVSMRRRFAQR